MANADLSWSGLVEADLGGANLMGASLQGAVLVSTKFISTALADSTFSDAMAGGTIFCGLDLRSVNDLDTMLHIRPSFISADTIATSEGTIPDVFLRGCGVNPLIQRLLVGTRDSMTHAFYEWVNDDGCPLRLASCFISYSTHDRPFVDRLQKALNAGGVDYWYAPEHGSWGKELASQIDREIETRDRVILVCSEDSLSSDWVRWEIDRTREQEKARGKTILYPVMLDDAVLSWNDSRASRIREILVGDFRGATKGRAFKERFGRLMEGLREG